MQAKIKQCAECRTAAVLVDGRPRDGVVVMLVQEPGEPVAAVFHDRTCSMVPPEALLTGGATAEGWMT